MAADGRLRGAWAVVLGASSGIGAACAVALAAAGADIVGISLGRRQSRGSAETTKAAIEALGRRAWFIRANAADANDRSKVLDTIAAEIGPGGVRVLIHSIGFGSPVQYIGGEPSTRGVPFSRQLAMTLDVMASSLVYWVRDLVGRGMLGTGGRVIALSSHGSHRVLPGYGAVGAAKAALEANIRQLAVELAPCGITANTIRAGLTDTAAFRAIPRSDELHERLLAVHPAGRITTPEDVAGVVVALSSPACGWLTGNTLSVDGGESIIG
jgi:NAD(P)-dependent dehydrogenase (short-subunit alcohol dehydrogenase family)